MRGSGNGSKSFPKQMQDMDPNHILSITTQDSRGYTDYNTDFDSFFSLNDSSIGVNLEDASRYTSMTANDSHTAQSIGCYPANEITSMFGDGQLDSLNRLGPSTIPQYNDGIKSTAIDTYPMAVEPYLRTCNWGTDHPVYPSTSESMQDQDSSAGGITTPTLLTPLEMRIVEATRAATKKRRESRQMEEDVDVRAMIQAKTTHGLITPESTTFEIPDKAPGSLPTQSSSATQDVQCQRMQELSCLGLKFYSQAKDLASQVEANPLALDRADSLVVKVLESSTKFRDLLTSLYPLHCSTENDGLTCSDNSTPRQCVPEDHERPGSSQQRHSDSSNDSLGVSPPRLDLTEIFALLTCYIRILHLHHLFYARLSGFLTSLSQQGLDLPPPFPGMKVGSVSLDSQAKFQVNLLVQFSTHILGEIEVALGLPDGYRISRKDRHGIFEGTVSLQFIEMTIREEAKSLLGGGNDKDKLTGIRDHLALLKQLLKGAIDS